MSEFQSSNFIKENGGTPNLVGKTELTSPYFFVPPSGTTAERPTSCAAGTLRFNTDIGTLEVYRGDTIGWEQIQRRDNQYLGGNVGGAGSNAGTGTRIFYAGGTNDGSDSAVIDYGTTSTLGDFQDFGDLLSTVGFANDSRACSTTRGIIAGSGDAENNHGNVIQFITVSSLGDAIDFGDSIEARNGGDGGAASPTRICQAGGNNPSAINRIDFVNPQTTGDSVDFGDLTAARTYPFGTSNSHGGVS